MTRPTSYALVVGSIAAMFAITAAILLAGCSHSNVASSFAPVAVAEAAGMDPTSPGLVEEGKQAFRFETFGDEKFWTDTLKMHQVIEKSIAPMTALKTGLKVDAEVLPPGVLEKADLTSPATTVALLKLNAIIGLRASVDAANHITSIGVTCALCHSSVDDSVMPGVGRRRDGWPNRDLDVGAIIALSPAVPAAKKAIYKSWGPGKYDPRYNQDGKSTPVLIPPAYGLAGVKNVTYTGDGSISYWNSYVGVTQMGGQGNFADVRLGIDVKHSPDVVTPKLAALRAYQDSLLTPPDSGRTFDKDMAALGESVFEKSCASCHVGGSGTDNNTDGKLHTAAETGVNGAYAARSASKGYRTTPLRALSRHAPYFHDGSMGTLEEVVAHYNKVRTLGLTSVQMSNLVQYLKSR
ncbi:MAG TPA: hypothetical protein VMZ90_13240 [Vicinamibacterales bacterium]|nr:hypothetical protein [Vicinamibacterales bacterium]